MLLPESYGQLEQLWRLCFVATMLAQHSLRVLSAATTRAKRGEAALAMHRAQPHHPCAPCNRCAACDDMRSVVMVRLIRRSRAGAAQTERQSVSAAAAVDHMTREEAFAAMDMVQPLRPIMRDAVYGYWADKRKRTGKPFIRRLWAPTSSSDQNPFSVFR